jgi:uncharacterized protein with PQ loop repeat
MNTINVISLIFGFIGCVSVIFAFIYQLNEIYKSKNAKGTSWGLIMAQIITCLAFGSSAAINVYLGGLLNIPFLIANTILFILFLLMSYMKYSYDLRGVGPFVTPC